MGAGRSGMPRTASVFLVAAVMVATSMFVAGFSASPVRAVTDVTVDNFEDGVADGWVSDNYESVTAVETPRSPSGGSWVGRVEIAYQCNGPSKHFATPVSPDYFRYYFRADGDTSHWSGPGVVLWASGSPSGFIAHVSYHEGSLRYSSAGYHTIMPATMNTWYLVELRNIDWTAETFDIWVDGVQQVTSAAFANSVDSVSYVQAYACPTLSGPLYLDDISYGYGYNSAPIADPNGPYLGPVTGVGFDGTASSDPDGDPLTYDWTWGDSTASPGAGATPTHAYAEPGIYEVCLTVNDGSVDSDEVCTSAVVYDPSAGFVTGGGWFDSPPGAYHPTGLPYFDGSFYEIIHNPEGWTFDEAAAFAETMTCATCGSAHLATITSQAEYEATVGLVEEWGHASPGAFQDEGVSPPDEGWQWVTGEPFDFEVTRDWWLPGEPNDCGTESGCPPGSEQMVEMYPDGWNDEPMARHTTWMVEYEDCDAGPTGKATFGFVSKYKKGASVPDGNTEFQFKAGDLNFHSSSYDWLVVTGSDYARFKGTGTINGAGEYKFMIWAGDGSPDTFRIKIWTEDELGVETIVYDNGADQPLEGGSIIVHTK